MAVLLLGLLTILLVLFFKWIIDVVLKRLSNSPPGSLSFPLVGNLPTIIMLDANKPYHALHLLARKYGDVMSVQMGLTNAVVISGYETVRSALQSDDFLLRFTMPWLRKRSFDKDIGILFGDIPVWKETRKFAMKNMRDFGFGKKATMEKLILEEIEHFTEVVQAKIDAGEALQIKGVFDVHLINSLFAIICGYKFELDDPKLKHLIDLLHEFFLTVKSGNDVLAAFPFLTRFMPVYYRQMKIHEEMYTFFRKILADARSRPDRFDNPSGFVDVFVNAIDSSGPDDIFNDENLLVVIYDFFMAGAETTSSVLEFLLLYLVLNEEVQEKLATEIERVIGRNRVPTYEDKNKMPYTEAVILETLRLATVLPITPRAATRATTIKGYHIPKKTFVMVNLYDVHMDPEYWGDPQVFRPERFLSPDGASICNTERLIPFSLGKRSCLGETIARMNLFLFTTRVFQLYRLEVEPGKRPTTEPTVGITFGVKPYRAVFRRRQ